MKFHERSEGNFFMFLKTNEGSLSQIRDLKQHDAFNTTW